MAGRRPQTPVPNLGVCASVQNVWRLHFVGPDPYRNAPKRPRRSFALTAITSGSDPRAPTVPSAFKQCQSGNSSRCGQNFVCLQRGFWTRLMRSASGARKQRLPVQAKLLGLGQSTCTSEAFVLSEPGHRCVVAPRVHH